MTKKRKILGAAVLVLFVLVLAGHFVPVYTKIAVEDCSSTRQYVEHSRRMIRGDTKDAIVEEAAAVPDMTMTKSCKELKSQRFRLYVI